MEAPLVSANFIYDIIEDAILESLIESEKGIWLPDSFEIELEDEAFQAFLKAGLLVEGKQVPLTLKRVWVTVGETRVLVRSDKDPEQWAIVPFKECLH